MSDTLFPPDDPGHTFTLTKGVDVRFSPHGVTVSLSSSLIKTAIAAAGLWFATRTGIGWDQITAGLSVSAGAAYSLWDSLKGSNEVTKALLGGSPK